MAATVQPITSPTTATLDDAIAWIKTMAERGSFPETTARFRINAINMFTSIYGEDEPRSVSYMLDNLDAIARRWATKNNNPTSVGDYRSRARSGLSSYIEFLNDPVNFRPDRREVKERKEKPARGGLAGESKPPESSQPASSTENWRSFPLGNGLSIEFKLPADGLTVAHVRRFAVHLATFASDFDPLSPQGVASLQITRREE